MQPPLCRITLALLLLAAAAGVARAERSPLEVGVAGHAFDHLGNIADQAPAALASGANIIYTTGVGSLGYSGLPDPRQLAAAQRDSAAYVSKAKSAGLRLSIGYVCATSILDLKNFDKHWTPEFRAQFSAGPAQWLQQDKQGHPLPSWYGGSYSPACMNNPDWRRYEHAIVRMQLEAGNDGVFFDNPTVHPQGCYCQNCMEKFAEFLGQRDHAGHQDAAWLEAMRKTAIDRPADFLRFRCTIAADFLADMRAYARSINPKALVTCNNSLNTPEAFYSQCRTYGYNIDQLSRAEDWVVVEDMATLPRVLPDGHVITYGPVYEMLRAISHGKPVVAITVAEADYHTPGDLVRLAMAEAAAHEASSLWWPTWPADVRQKMASALRPEADLLRDHADLLNGTTQRADVLLYLPFQRWVQTPECRPLQIARALDRENVQFAAVDEAELPKRIAAAPASSPVLVIESPDALDETQRASVQDFQSRGGHVVYAQGQTWMNELRPLIRRSVTIDNAPPTLRAIVRDQSGRTIVHLLNLNVQRLSSFEDRVTPATGIHLRLRIPRPTARSVRALTADPDATTGPIPFTSSTTDGRTTLELTLPRLQLSTILTIE